MATFPLINGDYFAYTDIVLQYEGLQFAGVKSINYKDSLSRAKVYGTASVPLGMTKGKYEASGDIEMYLDAANTLITSIGPTGWRQVPGVVTVMYGPNLGSNLPFWIDTIPGVYLGDFEASQSEGDEPLTRKFTLHIAGQILWNGFPSILELSDLSAVA